jgi:hypothetical protein
MIGDVHNTSPPTITSANNNENYKSFDEGEKGGTRE